MTLSVFFPIKGILILVIGLVELRKNVPRITDDYGHRINPNTQLDVGNIEVTDDDFELDDDDVETDQDFIVEDEPKSHIAVVKSFEAQAGRLINDDPNIVIEDDDDDDDEDIEDVDDSEKKARNQIIQQPPPIKSEEDNEEQDGYDNDDDDSDNKQKIEDDEHDQENDDRFFNDNDHGASENVYKNLLVKVYRGPTQKIDEKPFASWGYFVKYPTENR